MMKAMFVVAIPHTDCSASPVKLAEDLSYRIRVVGHREGFAVRYAVGAIRCGRPEEVEYLSDFQAQARDVVKQMSEGFALRGDATDRARAIALRLNATTGSTMRRVA